MIPPPVSGRFRSRVFGKCVPRLAGRGWPGRRRRRPRPEGYEQTCKPAATWKQSVRLIAFLRPPRLLQITVRITYTGSSWGSIVNVQLSPIQAILQQHKDANEEIFRRYLYGPAGTRPPRSVPYPPSRLAVGLVKTSGQVPTNQRPPRRSGVPPAAVSRRGHRWSPGDGRCRPAAESAPAAH